MCRQCHPRTKDQCIYGGPFLPSLAPITAEQARQRIAAFLNCNPNEPASWPIKTINELIAIEQNLGHKALLMQLNAMMTPPKRQK